MSSTDQITMQDTSQEWEALVASIPSEEQVMAMFAARRPVRTRVMRLLNGFGTRSSDARTEVLAH